MTDLDQLTQLVTADAKSRGETLSRLGYFCAPFRPASGPMADKVIKVYRSPGSDAALDRLVKCHDDYAAALIKAGVSLPATEMHIVTLGGAHIPVIVQHALPSDSMMRPLMQSASLEDSLAMMEAAGQVIARFWNAADQFETRIGFHPSIRNFAIVDDEAVFFDTFPPLIHYTRAEMGQMLLTYSESGLMRFVGRFAPARIAGIQDEWYSAPETLIGLVGSACRLRPEHLNAYLEWGRDFTQREMPRWQNEALAGLNTPPKLPKAWTHMRTLLGLKGEPNLK